MTDPKRRVDFLLREHPVNDLRLLHLSITELEIEITGVVRSYYLKQMAQEAVRPVLGGRRLRNKVIVISPRRVDALEPATDLSR